MTSSGPTGKSRGRHAADPELTPDSDLPARHATDTGAPQADPQADAETGPADDVQELQQQIEQTRQELGETVEQLVAKTDLKARARDQAVQLAGRVQDKASRARTQVAARARKVQGELGAKTGKTHQPTVLLDTAAKPQIPGRARIAAGRAREAMPEPARQAVAKGAGAARRHLAPLVVTTGALLAGYMVLRWRRRR